MLADDAAQRKLAKFLIEAEAGGTNDADDADDAGALAKAAIKVGEKLSQQLVPLIGAGGFSAVVAQAARLTKGQLPFPEAQDDFSVFVSSIHQQNLPQETEALELFIANVLGLLIQLLSRDLVYRYLRLAWPALDIEPPFPPDQGEKT